MDLSWTEEEILPVIASLVQWMLEIETLQKNKRFWLYCMNSGPYKSIFAVGGDWRQTSNQIKSFKAENQIKSKLHSSPRCTSQLKHDFMERKSAICNCITTKPKMARMIKCVKIDWLMLWESTLSLPTCPTPSGQLSWTVSSAACIRIGNGTHGASIAWTNRTFH